VLAVLGLVLPLGLDTFAVSAALGAMGLGRAQRIRLSLVFIAFEGLMPLVGLLIGDQLGTRIGDIGEYAAIAALFALGVYELRQDEEAEEALVERMSRASGAILLSAGLAVSLDELAIGFAFGLLNVPIVAAVLAIAAQALILSQLGFAIGTRIEERVRERAERLAGIVLIGLALLLLVLRLAGTSLG